jgi:hypothetical protein
MISQMCFLFLEELAKAMKEFGIEISTFDPIYSASLSPESLFCQQILFLLLEKQDRGAIK